MKRKLGFIKKNHIKCYRFGPRRPSPGGAAGTPTLPKAAVLERLPAPLLTPGFMAACKVPTDPIAGVGSRGFMGAEGRPLLLSGEGGN